MDFMLALNVTIYGLGIVFLALLVLMVAIMLLGKIFAVVTGKDLLATPQAATPAVPSPLLVAPASAAPAAVTLAPTPVSTVGEAEPVIAPLPGRVLSVAVHVGDSVKRGDELCVIEAMKMGNSVKAPRDGFVVDVRVAQGNTVAFGAPLVFLASSATAATPRPPAPSAAPAAPVAPVAEAAAFTLGAAGKTHAVELAPAGVGALTVLLDGARYDVRRDAGDRTKLVVNGQAHTVNVKEIAGTAVTVMIDGVTHKLEMGQQTKTAPRALSLTSRWEAAQGGDRRGRWRRLGGTRRDALSSRTRQSGRLPRRGERPGPHRGRQGEGREYGDRRGRRTNREGGDHP